MKALNLGPFWKLAFPLLASTLCFAVQPDRATKPIDSSQMVTLPGHVHRYAQAQYDQGRVEGSFALSHVTLLTVPSPSQQKALSRLLAEQQDPSSANYHKWLTPEQYADRFGLSPNDIRTISAWLKSQGFSILSVARGRNWIVFSGTASQIESAFRTEIHRYNVNGEAHFANATQPSIPAALSGIVAGIRGLDDFRPKPRNLRTVGPLARNIRPDYYDSSLQAIFLAPGDLRTIYDITPLYNAGIDGANQKLAVVGQTDVYLSDLNNFRSGFGLAPISGCTTNASGVITACNTSNFRYVLDPNTPDPGVSPPPPTGGDLGEADLDLELSAAVARGAQIIYVNSNNVVTSLYYAIDNNFAPVIGMSYGACEFDDNTVSADEVELTKANSFGITVVNSSGDSGAAGCDNATNSTTTPPNLAVNGLAVAYPASSPEVTGVGGTSIPLTEFTSTYWGTANGSDGGSALSYIPEIPWNDDVEVGLYCVTHPTASFCNGVTDPQTAQESSLGITSSGGGPSNCATQTADFSSCVSGFQQPSWQTVTLAGQASARFTPDVSLLASGFPGYIVCTQLSELGDSGTGSSCGSGGSAGITNALSLKNPSVFIGTSASAQVFAGIVVLLNQYLNGSSSKGLGNINPTLYKLAATPLNGAFHQVTNGNNIVYCQPGTPGAPQPASLQCPAGTTPQSFGFSGSNSDPTTGYNLVTGLGSVDVDKLAVAWAALIPGVKVQASSVTVTRGTPQNATITLSATNGFSGTVTVACTTPASMNEATCTPATQDVNIPAGGQVNATVTITATAPHTLAGLHRSRWASLGLLLVGALLLGNSGRKRQAGLLLLLTVGLLSATLLGCGGGGASGAVQDPGTTPGTYAVAITATSGGTTVGSGTLMVTVQ